MVRPIWITFGLVVPIGAFTVGAFPDFSLASRNVDVIQPDNEAMMGPPVKFTSGRRSGAKQNAVVPAPQPVADPTDAEVNEAMKAAAAAEALPPALDGEALANDVTDPAPADGTLTNDASSGMDVQKEVKMNVIGDDSQDATASTPVATSNSLRGSADITAVAAPSADITAVAAPSADAAVDGGDSKAEDLASAVSKAVANKKLAEQQAAKLDAQAEDLHRQAVEEQRKIEAGAVQAAHAAARQASLAEIKKAKEFRDRAVQAEREAKAQLAAAQAEMTQAVADAHEAARETAGSHN
jgi:hypothetical protein